MLERKCTTEQNNVQMNEVAFTVFGDPVPKARPRVYGGHGVTPERTKIQEQKIALVYKSKYHGFKFEKGVPLRMVVDLYLKIPKSTSKSMREKMLLGEIRPVKRIFDSDNGVKLAMDALNGVAYYDDAQVVEEIGRKFYSGEPRTEVYIAAIGEKYEE